MVPRSTTTVVTRTVSINGELAGTLSGVSVKATSAIVSLGSIASTQNVYDDGAKKPGIAPIAFVGEC